MDSVIRTIAYVGEEVRIINSRVQSTKNKMGEASYIGDGATIEDAHQLCKSVVGSGVASPQKYMKSYIHTAINGAIIGGSVGISDGTGFQSHWTRAEDTRLIDPFSKKIVKIPYDNKGSTPTIIGSNCRIAGGIQITSPLIVAASEIIGDRKGHARDMFSRMVVDGKHYHAERGIFGYRVKRDIL